MRGAAAAPKQSRRQRCDCGGALAAMTGTDGRQGRSFILAGLIELGFDHPDRLLEGKQLPRDDGLTQGRPDRLQFIDESVSAALIQLEAIRSVVQADNGLRDQWVVVSHPAHPRRRRAETPPPSSRISARASRARPVEYSFHLAPPPGDACSADGTTKCQLMLPQFCGRRQAIGSPSATCFLA